MERVHGDTFFVRDRTMAAIGHGHIHGGRHDEEEGSTSVETRTTRESTPDMKSIMDIKPMQDSGMVVGVDHGGSLWRY